MNRHQTTLLASILTLAMTYGTHAAESYPIRPIRLVVGSSAGGGGDGVARLVAARLVPLLGQQVVVDNRPGTPRSVIARLNETLNTVLRDADTVQRFKAMGNEIASSTPEQFDMLIRAEIPKWAEVVRQAGIRLE